LEVGIKLADASNNQMAEEIVAAMKHLTALTASVVLTWILLMIA
jgi:hypothetical protein